MMEIESKLLIEISRTTVIERIMKGRREDRYTLTYLHK